MGSVVEVDEILRVIGEVNATLVCRNIVEANAGASDTNVRIAESSQASLNAMGRFQSREFATIRLLGTYRQARADVISSRPAE